MQREALVGVLALAFSFLLQGCSLNETTVQAQLSTGAAPGTLVVDVLEGGSPEHYWLFEVRPATGAVSILKAETFQDYKHENFPSTFEQPAGHIETCAKSPHATSPDGKYVAYCGDERADEVYVIDKRSDKRLYQSKSGRTIRGFAWAPNQNVVAVLNVSSRVGKAPDELRALASGHPVYHDTVFLNLFDVKTATTKEILIRADVVSAFTRILKWRD